MGHAPVSGWARNGPRSKGAKVGEKECLEVKQAKFIAVFKNSVAHCTSIFVAGLLPKHLATPGTACRPCWQ